VVFIPFWSASILTIIFSWWRSIFFLHGLNLFQPAFHHSLHSRSMRQDHPMCHSNESADQFNLASDTSCHVLGYNRQVFDYDNLLDNNTAHFCTLKVTVTCRLAFPVTLFDSGVQWRKFLFLGSRSCRVAAISGQLCTMAVGFSWYFLQLLVPGLNRLRSQSHSTTKIWSWCLGSKLHLGPKTRILLLSDNCSFVVVWALSVKRTSLLLTAAKIRSTRHLCLQIYISAFYISVVKTTIPCGCRRYEVLRVTMYVCMYVM
jgi:hypothetical protein